MGLQHCTCSVEVIQRLPLCGLRPSRDQIRKETRKNATVCLCMFLKRDTPTKYLQQFCLSNPTPTVHKSGFVLKIGDFKQNLRGPK